MFFYNNKEKLRAELALFSVEKARALHLTSFLLSVLLWTIATSQSARGNFDSYCKMWDCLGGRCMNAMIIANDPPNLPTITWAATLTQAITLFQSGLLRHGLHFFLIFYLNKRRCITFYIVSLHTRRRGTLEDGRARNIFGSSKQSAFEISIPSPITTKQPSLCNLYAFLPLGNKQQAKELLQLFHPRTTEMKVNW